MVQYKKLKYQLSKSLADNRWHLLTVAIRLGDKSVDVFIDGIFDQNCSDYNSGRKLSVYNLNQYHYLGSNDPETTISYGGIFVNYGSDTKDIERLSQAIRYMEEVDGEA